MYETYNTAITEDSDSQKLYATGFEYDPIMSIDGAIMLNIVHGYGTGATRLFLSGNNFNSGRTPDGFGFDYTPQF